MSADTAHGVARASARAESHIETLEIRSALLSEFSGQQVTVRALVRTPAQFDPAVSHPIVYYVHGFGGSPAQAERRVVEHPEIVFVFLDASHPMGHHAFADSANTGPWGSALAQELVPAIDQRYASAPGASRRFIVGHSSGGWSALWIMITHPELFGGVWAVAPDPVDFRDFTNIDIYTFDNAYTDPSGAPVQLVYREGEPTRSLRAYVDDEVREQPVGGQFYSFDAVFSPRGADGTPRPLFDRQSGAIDPAVATYWQRYDISRLLRDEWARRGPALAGKLHVIVGTQDTFGLHRPARLLADALGALGSDARFDFVQGRDHFDVYAPHPDHHPQGLWQRIAAEVVAAHDSG